jgi:hypothetical protein
MTEPARSAAENLTGVWNGVFRQPFHGAVNFTATLIESGTQISGSTHEPCAQLDCPRRTHLATLAGHRQSSTVSFVKTYDPPGFGYYSVSYSGELSADHCQIAGMWTIGSFFSGPFVMTRARPRAQTRTRKTLATVPS